MRMSVFQWLLEKEVQLLQREELLQREKLREELLQREKLREELLQREKLREELLQREKENDNQIVFKLTIVN